MRSASFLLCALLALSLGGFAGAATGTVRSAPSAANSSMYMSFSGPTEVATHWTCSWYAYVSGGTAPYTYQWSEEGMVREESYDNFWRGRAVVGGTVWLNVLVTDASGKSAWGYLGITSDNNAPLCMD